MRRLIEFIAASASGVSDRRAVWGAHRSAMLRCLLTAAALFTAPGSYAFAQPSPEESAGPESDASGSKTPLNLRALIDAVGGGGGGAVHLPEDDEKIPSTAAAAVEPDGQFVRVGADDRVTVHLKNMPLADAVRMLGEPARKNIVLLKGVEGMVTATLFNVTFDAALDAMLIANGLAYRREGDFIFVMTQEEARQLELAERKLETLVYRLSYMNADAAKIVIEPLRSEQGKIVVTPASKIGLGGEAGLKDTEGNALAGSDTIILTDYPENLSAMVRVLDEMDERPQQVLIEATILRATLTEDNALGIDFTTVGGIDFTELNSVSPAAQNITTGLTPADKLDDTTLTVRTDFNAAVPAGGFTFGIIKDQIGVFIRALEEVTDTEVIANPKVPALNKQYAQLIVGRRDGYLTTVVTETTSTEKIEFLETGTILSFRPFIGKDGYVRMEIHPKDSTGGLTATNLPFEQTTEVTTNVMVRDGHTILIGGLFREVSSAGRGQVPGLGNLPIVGPLFRTTIDNTVREEVIILLTVRIIKGAADEAAAEELLQDVERFRVGARSAVQWFGRERLAQAHYAWALQHLAAGRIDKAEWDARMALNNFPRHVHAAQLIEKIRGERAWETEASAVRTFVRDLIMRESGPLTPAFGRPAPPFELPEGIRGDGGLDEADNDLPAGEWKESAQPGAEGGSS